MPQMKSTDNNSILDTASTDSSVFESDNPKSRSAGTWSVLSGGTSSSSVISSISADGLTSELIARGPSTSHDPQPPPSPYMLVPSLMELTTNEKVKAAGLKSELQGFMNKVTDMEDQLLSLKKTLVHKQKYISTLETNLKRIEGNNSSLKSEVLLLQKDNESLRRKLHENDGAGSSRSPTHRRQDRMVSPVPSERETQLGCELDRVLQENASLKQKIQGLEEELSHTIQKLEQTRLRHEQRRQDMELLLLQASKELEHVEAQRTETARLLNEAMNKSTGATARDEGGKTQLESLLLLQKPSLTVKELSTIKDRLFAAHKQIDVLETDFREEHDQRLCAERDLARMKATVRDLERECDTLRLQVQFLQEDFYREREDKRVLERNLKAKDSHFHTRVGSTERGATGGTEPYMQVYQGATIDLQGGDFSRVEAVQRTSHIRRSLPSDVVCDSNMMPGNPVTNDRSI